MRFRSIIRLGYGTVFVGVIVAVLLMIGWEVSETLQENRTELSEATRLAAVAVGSEHLTGLSYSSADYGNPSYQRLRTVFLGLGRVFAPHHGVRYMYVTRLVDGQTVFVADSADEGDQLHRVPGTAYTRPNHIVPEILRGGPAGFWGPQTDEQGSFYSAAAPVTDDSGAVIAAVGADMEKGVYDSRVKSTLEFYGTAGLIIVLMLVGMAAALEVWSGEVEKRRRQELARASVAEQREKLLFNIGEGVVAFNRRGEILFANRFAVNSVYGQTRKPETDRTGRGWTLLDELGQPLAKSLQPQGGNLPDSEAVRAANPHLRRPYGTLFPIGVSFSSVEENGNSIVVMTFRDMTREAEIDRMKTDFISMAVHQIKTPLTALKWSVEVLSASKANPAAEAEAVAGVVSATQRLNELVSDLLNVSRIEAGRLTVDPTPTDLGSLAADVMKELEPEAARKRVFLTLSAAPDLASVSLDRLLIREVYKNLMTNAIKYSPTGSKVNVFVQRQGEDIVSSVKDEGVGIPEGEKKRLFDRFFRASNVIELPEEGTGLGLYFAKKIVETSGGRIWFESTEGAGSTFSFSVPLAGSLAKKGEVRLGRTA